MNTAQKTGSLLEAWPIENPWSEWVLPLTDQDEWAELECFVDQERKTRTIYPERSQVFGCFRLTPPKQTKVVILGQDPYHGPKQAHGLAFSVRPGNPSPPSLRNIFKELQYDLAIEPPENGDLTGWAKQGVLLLNTILTVSEGEPLSHAGRGWEWFTDSVIRAISQFSQPVVFMLWGKSAEVKTSMLNPAQLQIVAPHPSPLAAYRGFFGSKPFSRANEWLVERGVQPVNWDLNSDSI